MCALMTGGPPTSIIIVSKFFFTSYFLLLLSAYRRRQIGNGGTITGTEWKPLYSVSKLLRDISYSATGIRVPFRWVAGKKLYLVSGGGQRC
jgi:hypothetical protein